MSTAEHPFAPYIRILGKGPRLSRSLTQSEAKEAFSMILAGQVEPVQLGAFLCLLRVKTETPEEIAGFVEAIRDMLPMHASLPPVDLDWPSYAGKSRQLPYFLLAALLLTQNGLSVAMHGSASHTAGRIFSGDALAVLGIRPAGSLEEAGSQLRARRFTFLPLEVLHPMLPALIGLKSVLGLRSPLNTVLRNINPLGAGASLMSVFHPNYRAIHRNAAEIIGPQAMACFKGEGGEVERRPEKPCLVEGLRDGVPFSLEWPARRTVGAKIDQMVASQGLASVERLRALWRGEIADDYAEEIVAATAAVALHLVGRAATPDEADAMAASLWRDRNRDAELGTMSAASLPTTALKT